MYKASLELQNYVAIIATKLLKEEFISTVTNNSEQELRNLLENPFAIRSHNEIDFGADFMSQLKEATLQSSDKTKLQCSCKEFLVTLLKELLNRLPTHLTILSQAKFVSPEIVLCHKRPHFSELPLIFCPSEERTNAEAEYDLMITLNWKELLSNDILTNSEEFWRKAYRIKNAIGEPMLKSICLFAFNILSLPHSNAIIERTFSIMNIIKTKIRNRMMLETLASILRIKINFLMTQDCCKSFSPTQEMLKLFNASIDLNENKEINEEGNGESIEEIIEWKEWEDCFIT